MRYKFLDKEDQREALETRIKTLELEHFGLVNGFSAVPHAAIHEEGETADDALARVRKARLPHVKDELKELHATLAAMDD